MTPVPLASVVRGELIESVHAGSVVAVDPDGAAMLEAGDTRTPMYPRSAVKPVQGLGMLRAGLELDGELLALACASHGGEPFHIDGVRQILAGAGLAEADLQNTPQHPSDPHADRAYGPVASCVAANCSGKHAAMLATCVANGWPTTTYRDPDHPLQRRIAETITELAGEPIAATTVDGCGAPLFGLSLRGLAAAFSAVRSASGGPERRVSEAVAAYPEWVAATRHPSTALARAIPGSVVKPGAEGVLAFAVPDGPAVAIKVADGSPRPLPAIAAAVLGTLGIDNSALRALSELHVHGHGKPVGAIRAEPLPATRLGDHASSDRSGRQ